MIENLFMDIADDVTTGDGQNLAGVININTAGLDVLVCLPGMSRELAQAIISQRQSGGYFANIGELLKVPEMTRDIFKQIAPLVTARSETFRIFCEGKINSTGARQRIQAIVHVGLEQRENPFMAGGRLVKQIAFLNPPPLFVEIGHSWLKALRENDGVELPLERLPDGRLTARAGKKWRRR